MEIKEYYLKLTILLVISGLKVNCKKYRALVIEQFFEGEVKALYLQ